jgi:hypothetical protein
MYLKYKIDNLPFGFVFMGFIFLIYGAWLISKLDWLGVILILVALPCLFINRGILIDSNKKRLKKYVGFLVFKRGNWVDISSVKHLAIIEINESTTMNLTSVTNTYTALITKLILVLPDENIELLKGKKKFINKAAEKISGELQTTIIQ